ncbi:NgoFVII family restriction endonuclease [Microbacterium resistens]|uniref:helicase-related protein n=1 Tax=Microbacterium resistens TaxID=156977 RepID=UPI001C56C1B7|nr:helicase-related protein [Microbacterium resistens]MBW1640053.1 NgoFVII family restriction endonuclease [Microbacterium resistens]
MTRIFDNIELNLGGHLVETLLESDRIDAAVGYFNLRGWKLFGDVVEQRQPGNRPVARVLVGMVSGEPNEQVLDYLQRTLEGAPLEDVIDRKTARSRQQQAKLKFRQQLMRGAPTTQDEATIRELRSQLADGRVAIKLFTRRPLHGKTYICHRDDKIAPIVAYVGSSNLTIAGLANNYELNVDVVDSDGAAKLDSWFEDRWNDRFSIDVTADLIDIIDESWASEIPLTPYEVYLKVCWHLSRDVREGLIEYTLPPSMRDQLLEYQESAVKTLSRRIMTKGGAMLGDVVGLGKTITATATAMMLNEAEGYRTLIVCPVNLVRMWEEYKERYSLNATVVPYSMAAKRLPNLGRYQFVIVDESHTLRNDTRQDYKALYDYIRNYDCRVLLLTATPYNIRFKDVANQLGLYIDPDDDLGLQPVVAMSMDDRFAEKLDGKTSTLEAFKRSEEPDDWKRLMSEHLIRRTRSFVRKNHALVDEQGKEYLTFANGTRFTFPIRVPKPLVHSFGENDPAAKMESVETLDTIDNLKLARYNLSAYLRKSLKLSADEKLVVERFERGSGHLIGFVRSGLYKRLSSCGYSFVLSLQRHIARNQLYIYAVENDLELPLGTLLDVMLTSSESDDDAEEDFEGVEPPTEGSGQRAYEALRATAPKSVRWIRPSVFTPQLLDDLRVDTETLLGLLDEYGTWTTANDSKLAAVTELLTKTHPDEKVLIFTEYKDTANYVAEALRAAGLDRVGVATGETNNPTDVARRFAPMSNMLGSATLTDIELEKVIDPSAEYRVLIATDVLSEGQNLQDAHIVVNYDLPWAIIRLIQRAGRVDRVGQKSDEVLIYSLWHDGVEQVLNLRQRIADRLHANAEVFGSDEQFFGSEDEVKIIEDLYKGKLDDNELDNEVDASSLAYEVWSSAEEQYPELAERVRELPDLVYSTRSALSNRDVDGVVCYIRTENDNDGFGFGSADGVRLLTGQEALGRFRCEPDTAALPARADHFPLLAQMAQGNLVQNSNIEGRLSGVRKRVWNRLNGALVAGKGEVADALEAIFTRPLTKEAEKRFTTALAARSDLDDLADLLVLLHRDKRLVVDVAAADPIHIVCSMGVVS